MTLSLLHIIAGIQANCGILRLPAPAENSPFPVLQKPCVRQANKVSSRSCAIRMALVSLVDGKVTQLSCVSKSRPVYSPPSTFSKSYPAFSVTNRFALSNLRRPKLVLYMSLLGLAVIPR